MAADSYQERFGDCAGDAEFCYRLGTCHDRLHEWDKARVFYEKAVSLRAGMAKWHYRLGFVNERLHDFAGAAECYQTAVDCYDKHVSLWYYRLGYVLAKACRHEEACKAYLKSRLNAGIVAEGAGGMPGGDAGGAGNSGIDGDSGDPQWWWQKGNLHETRSEWRDASRAYHQAVMRCGKYNALWYFRLGCSLMNLGDYQSACEAFRNSRVFTRASGITEEHFKGKVGWKRSAIYAEYYETLEIRENAVLYESFHGMSVTCNPYALFLEILGRDEFRDWSHIWVVNDGVVIPQWMRSLENVVFVARDSDAYMRHLSSAKVLINNNTFPPYFIRKEGQTYLNTWHGTPWKTLGKDINDDVMAHANTARNFLQATHIISPNHHTTDVLIKRYDVEGLFRGVVAETGYPRIDLTLNCEVSAKIRLRKRLGVPDGKKVVLYAPTWRGTLGNPQFDADETEREIKSLMEIDCHVLFRGHHLGGDVEGGVVVPEEITTNELLAVIDLLITDYSSISFDFIATGCPILYYLKDYENYAGSRGLYFGVEGLPGTVVYDLAGLCEEVRNVITGKVHGCHPNYESAKRRFSPHEDGRASKRVVDLVFFGPEREPDSANKHSILIYAGQFIPNGVTNSLINLLNLLDYSKVQVSLAVDASQITKTPERLEQFRRLPAEVRVVPRAGRANFTLEERWISESFGREHHFAGSEERFQIYKHAFEREYRRVFGVARFDTAIEFTGYSIFWSSIMCFSPQGLIGFKSIYLHSDMHCEWGMRFPQLECIFRLYPFFDRLISVCGTTRDLNVRSLSEKFGLPSGKFDFCENLLNPGEVLAKAGESIDPREDELLFGSGSRVFISIGRLSVEKDHRKLVQAFYQLRRERDDVRLIIVGDGPLYPEITRIVKTLRLEKDVFLLGFRSNPFPYLRKSDCFVFSSNYEGQGLVLLEAMILRKPIVSTDIDVCRSVIENRSGHMVENSVEGLAAGMKDFLEGNVFARDVDFEPYQRNALDAFCRKTCNIM